MTFFPIIIFWYIVDIKALVELVNHIFIVVIYFYFYG